MMLLSDAKLKFLSCTIGLGEACLHPKRVTSAEVGIELKVCFPVFIYGAVYDATS